MNRPISSLMQRHVVIVDMDATVGDVERLFAAHDLRWAPVLEGGQTALGVISAADLLVFEAEGRDRDNSRAWQLCTYRPLSVAANTPAADVARKMVEHKIHHVVVMDGPRVAGVVSSLDFVRAFAES